MMRLCCSLGQAESVHLFLLGCDDAKVTHDGSDIISEKRHFFPERPNLRKSVLSSLNIPGIPALLHSILEFLHNFINDAILAPAPRGNRSEAAGDPNTATAVFLTDASKLAVRLPLHTERRQREEADACVVSASGMGRK